MKIVYNPSFSETLVTGTRKSYQEIMIEGLRDYIIQEQIHYSSVNWSRVVIFIQEVYPGAWPGKVPGQVGKRLKTNMSRVLKQRKAKKRFVKGSG